MSQMFTLFNQELVIEDDYLLDIHVRRLVMHFAETAQKDFENFYQKKLHGMDDLIKKGEECAFTIMESQAQKCAEILASLDIYNISASTILRKMHGSYFSAEFEQLVNWYSSVLDTDAQKDAYRKARRQNRSRWVGVGLGLNGTAYAATQAGVLNLASGAAHGAVNLVGKSFSAIGTSISKNGMFKDKNTRKRLAQALYMDIYEWIYILESIISQSGIEIEPIPQRDEQRAANLFENLKSKNLDTKQYEQIAFQLFDTNPCEFEYYAYCIDKFPEQQKHLLALARYCHVDEDILADTILRKVYDSMPHSTEDQLHTLYQTLKEKQTALDISKSQIVDNVEKELEKLDLEARTFKKLVFETREEKRT